MEGVSLTAFKRCLDKYWNHLQIIGHVVEDGIVYECPLVSSDILDPITHFHSVWLHCVHLLTPPINRNSINPGWYSLYKQSVTCDLTLPPPLVFFVTLPHNGDRTDQPVFIKNYLMSPFYARMSYAIVNPFCHSCSHLHQQSRMKPIQIRAQFNLSIDCCSNTITLSSFTWSIILTNSVPTEICTAFSSPIKINTEYIRYCSHCLTLYI